jgi:prepilin signal peptidase PulO-like enzyme (type II secretory pathway)
MNIILQFAFIVFSGVALSIEDIRHLSVPTWGLILTFIIALFIHPENWYLFGAFFLLAICCMLLDIGMGEADFFVIAIWSLFFEIHPAILILFIASSLGLLFQLVHYFVRGKLSQPLPFLPFLTIGAVISFICQANLLDK